VTYTPPTSDEIRHRRAKNKIDTAAKVLLSEARWLETAITNHEQFPTQRQESPAYIAGFRAAAHWVRFHGENPHLLADR
jgi:hypothetical protein